MTKLCGHSMGTFMQCTHNTHLLGELGDAPTMKRFWNYKLWDCFWGCFWPQIPFFQSVCLLHVHMKACLITGLWPYSFPNYFTCAPVNFMWAQAQVCLGVATPLHNFTTFILVCMHKCPGVVPEVTWPSRAVPYEIGWKDSFPFALLRRNHRVHSLADLENC